MGIFGSIFGSKQKTSNDPWKPAQPYILKGMEQTNQVFDANQPRLADMSTKAYDAFGAMAPGAFGTNGFVQNAQNSAGAIAGGGLFGSNSSQGTYDRMLNPFSAQPQGSGMKAAQPVGAPQAGGFADPSTNTLARLATSAGGNNPGNGFAQTVASGGYLNNQPSSGAYENLLSKDYLNGNPFIEQMIAQTKAGVTKDANRQFASRGMGAGLSSAFGDVLSKNLAGAENNLRYQNYNDASNRQLQAAGQSDAAWSGERGRMDASTGLLSDNYNQGQQRQLAAAQALGGQQLQAASQSDAAQNSQVAQMLQAMGLTGELRNAEYAGVSPTLSLLNTAADLPYVGVGALNGNIRQASNGYGTSTTTSTPSVMQAAGQVAQMAAAASASDRRLKTDIAKVGEFEDGLGVYEYDYRDPERFGEGRQRGVMADEVRILRPWALGPKIDGEYDSVYYSKLERAA